MATLTERLDALEPQLQTLRNAAEERGLIQALRTRSAQVAARKEAVQRSLALIGRVERLGASTKGRPRASAPLRGRPAALSKQLAATPESVIDAGQWDASFLAPLDAFTAKLADVAGEQWRARVDEVAPPLPEEVLAQFEKTGFERTVKEVRAAHERIREIRARVPDSDDALKEVTELGVSIKRTLADLDKVPPVVRRFIPKAATFDATFDDLTDEVVEWLREHDMLKHVRVGLR